MPLPGGDGEVSDNQSLCCHAKLSESEGADDVRSMITESLQEILLRSHRNHGLKGICQDKGKISQEVRAKCRTQNYEKN